MTTQLNQHPRASLQPHASRNALFAELFSFFTNLRDNSNSHVSQDIYNAAKRLKRHPRHLTMPCKHLFAGLFHFSLTRVTSQTNASHRASTTRPNDQNDTHATSQ